MDYRSITLVSSNEDGREELSVERNLYLPEILSFIFREKSFKWPDTVTETYVLIGRRYVDALAHWRNKVTGEVPDRDRQQELDELRREVKRQSSRLDFLT
jgi:cell shape-determining protein MreC